MFRSVDSFPGVKNIPPPTHSFIHDRGNLGSLIYRCKFVSPSSVEVLEAYAVYQMYPIVIFNCLM